MSNHITDPEGYIRRVYGQEDPGIVGVRDFDRGVVETLGGVVDGSNYWLKDIDGLAAPPGAPGIPITFSWPEDIFEKYRQPVVMIRRDDISPDNSRYHHGSRALHGAAKGALPRSVLVPTQFPATTVTGFDKNVTRVLAHPFDFTYTISLLARYRGSVGLRNQVNALLAHTLSIYQPYSFVYVIDSVGDSRTYFATMEGISNLDEASGVTDRTLGFAVTVRVEGELDINPSVEHKAVTALPTITMSPLDP